MRIVHLNRAQLARLIGGTCRAQAARSAADPIDIFDDETFVGVLDEPPPAKRSRAKITITHLRSAS